jgi:hypothetical protein
MAESSFFSWTTDGTGDGTLTGYTQAQWTSLWRMLYLSDTADEGVFNNYLNELAVTNPSGRDLSINTGGAIVYGFPYINSAAVTKTLTHPVVGTTGWRLVLRADWTAQTVRITLLESADGTATIPAMTQTANTTWDVPLAEGTITTGDVIAITDARVFVHPNIEVENAMMAANSVDSDQYVDGSIDTAHLSNDSVDDTKAGNRVPQFYRRQGGDATNWSGYSTGGTTAYTPGAVRMQGGFYELVVDPAAATGDVDITYPVAFSAAPLVYVSVNYVGVTSGTCARGAVITTYQWAVPSATKFTAYWYSVAGDSFAGVVAFNWLAIGPE